VKLEWSWVWLLSTSNQRKGSRGGTVPRFRVCGKWRTFIGGLPVGPRSPVARDSYNAASNLAVPAWHSRYADLCLRLRALISIRMSD
jgi:hypothetical protein